jgi:hypothetical protein
MSGGWCSPGQPSFGMGEFLVTGDAADVAMAEQVLTDLARAAIATDEGDADGVDGVDGARDPRRSMDQRRFDAFFDVFRRIRDGDGLPTVPEATCRRHTNPWPH